jgi:RNA-binding protein
MSLTIAEKKRFRRIGHELKPVVMLGNNGLSETVLAEIGRALDDHELIKVRIGGEDREARAEAIAAIANSCQAVVVQIIGKVVVLYKRAKKPDPKLSNLLRFAKLDQA